jgi:heat shock protein HslJ
MSEQSFSGQGRIGIQAERESYALAPAGGATITVLLRNQGLEDDRFALVIAGIPAAWLPSPMPVVALSPGEVKRIEVSLTTPPLADKAIGEIPITIRASSQRYPGQSSEVKVGLITGATGGIAKFNAELTPKTIRAGQNAQVSVTNEGDRRDSFTISWQSRENSLAFLLWQSRGGKGVFKETEKHVLDVDAGEQASVRFRAGLRQRPLLGGTTHTPFQIQVNSSSGDTATQDGEVKDQAAIPLWVLPVALILCAALIFLGIFLFNQSREQGATAATQTAEAATVVAGRLEQTIAALGTHSAQLTAGFPTDTQEPTSTVTPTEIPTETPIPTHTLTPTDTPVPTETPTTGPTEILTETPTEEQTPTERPGAELLGKTWVLEAILANLDDQDLTEALPDVTVDLIFNENDSFNGNGGCNPYAGGYVTDGMQINFENLAATKTVCGEPEGIMEQEASYLGWLELAEEYHINPSGKLEIILYVFDNNQRIGKILLVYHEQDDVS